MTLKEMYSSIGSDLDDVLKRLRKPELVARLVKKYDASNSKHIDALESAIAEKRYDDVFDPAHAVKGVAMNLGFARLADSATELTEAARAGDFSNVDAQFAQVKKDHAEVIEALNNLDE